jgi:hypothetical protein
MLSGFTTRGVIVSICVKRGSKLCHPLCYLTAQGLVTYSPLVSNPFSDRNLVAVVGEICSKRTVAVKSSQIFILFLFVPASQWSFRVSKSDTKNTVHS